MATLIVVLLWVASPQRAGYLSSLLLGLAVDMIGVVMIWRLWL